MISSMIHHPCEITLHLYSSDVFIHPPKPNTNAPSHDKTLRGLVEIKVPSERTIHGVRVSLTGHQTLAIPQRQSAQSPVVVMRYEEKTLLEKVVEITGDSRRATVKDAGSLASSPSAGDAGLPGYAEAGDNSEATHAASGAHDGSGINGSTVSAKGKGKMEETMGESSGLHLDKGIHGFEFAFIIPASVPPFERAKHGRIRYTLAATAMGAGRGKSNISTGREIFIIAQVNPDGGPVPLDLSYHDVHEALGAMSVSLTSASLTVGGAATLSVHHPSPPPGVNVHVVRAFVEQTLELYSTTHKSWIKLGADKLRMWERGYQPFKDPSKQIDPSLTEEDAFWIANEDGKGHGRPGRAITNGTSAPTLAPFGWTAASLQPSPSSSQPPTPGTSTSAAGVGVLSNTLGSSQNGYKIKAVVRMPDDNTMRPSTMSGSRTDIRVSHEVGVEFYFSRLSVLDERENSETKGKPKVQLFTMRRPVSVQSCVATFDAIHLPPYSLESPFSSRPPSPVHQLSSSHGSGGGGANTASSAGVVRGRPGGLARNSSQNDIDHWTLKQTLKAALGSHANSGQSSGATSGSGLRSAERSEPNSRPSSRNTSPTRHGGIGNYFGRRSRPSSPTRGHQQLESGGASLSTSPLASGVHRPIARRGHTGLHALTPSNRSSPQTTRPVTPASGLASSAPSAAGMTVPMPTNNISAMMSAMHIHGSASNFPTIVTAPPSGTTTPLTPRSLPPNSPWALSGFPTRTPTSHDACQCGKTTEELIEAENRLLEGAPTAPGMWVETHDEGELPPPWTPSRPSSPVLGFNVLPAGGVRGDAALPIPVPGSAVGSAGAPDNVARQDVSGWYRGQDGTREGGRLRGKVREAEEERGDRAR